MLYTVTMIGLYILIAAASSSGCNVIFSEWLFSLTKVATPPLPYLSFFICCISVYYLIFVFLFEVGFLVGISCGLLNTLRSVHVIL